MNSIVLIIFLAAFVVTVAIDTYQKIQRQEKKP